MIAWPVLRRAALQARRMSGSATQLDLSHLTAISPIDGRYGDKTAELRPIFSEFGLIRNRVIVEIRWLQMLSKIRDVAEVPKLSSDAAQYLESIIDGFSEEDARKVKAYERVTNHDVKSVEYFVKDKMTAFPELAPLAEFVHFACTSEDVNNLAYALMLKEGREQVLLPTMTELVDVLASMAERLAHVPMLALTHGQPATPTTVGKEIANITYRLDRQRCGVANVPITGKANGAVGNFNAHRVAYPSVDWATVVADMIEGSLGLTWNPYTTQIEPHDCVAELSHAVCRFNTVLLDHDRDMWTYISRRLFKQRAVEGEVGSSTMPHKVNPIDFENSEGNLGLANATLEHLASKLPVSRMQRDLSDSTVMRALGVGFAHSMVAYKSTLKGLSRVEVDEHSLQEELAHNWEVLAEPIQTVMRRYGVEKPYEKLKEFTRGKRVDEAQMKAFVSSLEGIPEAAREELAVLTPWNYTGNAADMALRVRAHLQLE
mmetsp:Transcript_1380/g.4071  ORF Transcript_1380/g.4071 Transcript_1380/m.4071 type:complete len:488 (-) Transcript_1380:54-1517(-)